VIPIQRKRVVAVLDSMYDWRRMTSGAGYRQAPRWFRINPRNHSGRRLYKLVGAEAQLLVTDACQELLRSSRDHGTPDPAWLRANLVALEPFHLLLVCGTVAQRTYEECGYSCMVRAPVLKIHHPAARTWTKAQLTHVTRRIAKELRR
jgi:hypothetical protein